MILVDVLEGLEGKRRLVISGEVGVYKNCEMCFLI